MANKTLVVLLLRPTALIDVRQAFRKYLKCGIFAHGFARARCADCGHDYFVTFSCKGSGACPSCNTRRMVETAAHLTDRLPVRQWVLSVPKRLRYFMQRDGAVLNMVLRIFLRVIAQSLQAHCPGAARVDKAALHTSAIAFIHRFDSSLNGHVHFKLRGRWRASKTAQWAYPEAYGGERLLTLLWSLSLDGLNAATVNITPRRMK